MSGREPDTETNPAPSVGSDGRDRRNRGESDDLLEGQVVFKGPRKLQDLLNGDG